MRFEVDVLTAQGKRLIPYSADHVGDVMVWIMDHAWNAGDSVSIVDATTGEVIWE